MSDNPFLVLDGPICGSLYFASVMSSGFYGVTCMQTFFYYVHYRNDPLRMKSFVAALWAFNTIHEALIIAGVYKYIMAGLANPASILNGIPELLVQLVFTGLVAVPTQGFFVYRIYIFNGRNIFGPLIWVPLAIYQLVSTILYVTKGLYIADSSVHAVGLQVLNEPFFKDLASSSLSVAVTVDVLIAVVLMFLLVRKRAETGFSSTAHVLQRLTVFVVNAGIWTATFAILSLLFVHLYPSSLLNTVFTFSLCPVYLNTLLANLNARAYIRGATTAYNTDVDLFASKTSQAFDSTGGDKPHGEHELVSLYALDKLSPSARLAVP